MSTDRGRIRAIAAATCLVALWGAGAVLVAVDEPTASGSVLIGDMRSAITPVTVEYVARTLEKARAGSFDLVVFEMDTPGGLAASTADIIRDILASPVPVAIYVSPAGAQAASAGLYITNAADIAVMAPGTRIGAGHPVSVGGGNPGGEEQGGRDFLGEKIEHDMAAGVRSIASNRGRNVEVYERMVRESVSYTEQEALAENVIDLIAVDLDELLSALDGQEVTRFDGTVQTVSLGRPRIERLEMTLRQRILSWVADPQISFLLLAIGMLGLYVEFNNPGLIAPGVVGGLALLLFAMSVQILPVNALGLALIALAITLFVLEIKFTSYGFLTAGGIACLTLGFLTLFDTEGVPALQLSLEFVIPTSVTVGLVMLGVTAVAVRAQQSKVVTGGEGLVGEIGRAVTDVGRHGRVFVHGEYWNARSSQPIARETAIRVTAVREMELEVESADI